MTAAGQEIMNRLAILPETNYGPYQFKHTITNTISSVIGTGPKVERTIARMTELGMLVWSKTSRMARVVDTEKTYRIVMCSDGGTIKRFDSMAKADNWLCSYVTKNGYSIVDFTIVRR